MLVTLVLQDPDVINEIKRFSENSTGNQEQTTAISNEDMVCPPLSITTEISCLV